MRWSWLQRRSSSTAGIGWAARTSLALLLVAVAGSGCGDSSEGPADEGHARVTKVTDGDTLHLSGIGPVRLIGVDTPEVHGGVECFGAEASRFAARLVPLGARVRYRAGAEERDRYGRLLAYVWLPDGRMLNRVMVRRGFARPLTIPPNVEFSEAFRRAAAAARRSGRGLWRACARDG